MPLILSGNVASATAGGYEVANSCRFGTNTYMDKDNSASSPTHADKYTISFWCKKCQTSGGGSGAPAENGYTLFLSSGSGTNGDLSDHYCQIYFKNEDDIRWQEYDDGTSGQLETNQVFRDPSAWYHLVFRFDSTDGTADDRMRIYVNGTQVTSFQTRTNIDQNTDSWVNYASAGHRIGGSSARYFDGYLAEFVLVDGQSLAPTEFGEFDEDSPTIWKAKDVSGLTFGTHGYYLDFEDSSALGNDANGGTDFSVTNLAATDQTTDTPTNNFCTMNPLDNTENGGTIKTFTEGNCKIETEENINNRCRATFGLTSGKWYCEIKITQAAHLNYQTFGFTKTTPSGTGGDDWLGGAAGDVSYYSNDGKVYNNNVGSSVVSTATTGDVIGLFLDLDNDTANFSKNGTMQNSGTGYDISGISHETSEWFFACGDAVNSTTTAILEINFGNPSWSLSSAVSDANGYGSFEYTPSVTTDSTAKNYLAMCTKNLGSDGG